MIPFALVLCGIAGCLMLVMALTARPTRGENLTGAHLVTGPIAIAFTLGGVLVHVAAPLSTTWANVLLGIAWPGVLVATALLPLAGYGRKGGWVGKVAVPAIVAAPFLLGYGAAWHAAVPSAGGAVLMLVGLAGLWPIVQMPLRRLRWRLMRLVPFRSRQPSDWEAGQAEWQRGEWRKLPPDAPVAELLGHVRSLAPDVRAECHARLAALADLDEQLANALAGPMPGNPLWYVAFHYPRSRRPLAAAIVDLLARMRATLPNSLREDPHPRPWSGDLMPALEAALTVLRDGGDVRAELEEWHRELATMPKFAREAKHLRRAMQKVG
ncbi:MAG: hypothetical protein JNK15_12735 [Planctomycetes bacterium]|nr:hypothetical protein [Planctomycetota bacterium]